MSSAGIREPGNGEVIHLLEQDAGKVQVCKMQWWQGNVGGKWLDGSGAAERESVGTSQVGTSMESSG